MKKQMGWLWLLLGGCFLWNPVVGVKDLLPDVVGYFLLCIGIGKLADLNDRMADAQNAFRAMLWVGMGQVAAWLLVEKFLQKTDLEMNRYEEPVWVLVFAFAFLVLEWYFMLSGWKHFFDGLSDLAQYHGGSAVLRERKRRTPCEYMTMGTRAFVMCKTVLTVLPEASVLTAFGKQTESNVFFFDWFPYLSVFRVICVLIGLMIGLIWLIGYVRLMRTAMKDEPWQARLQERYRTEILPDFGLQLNRRVKNSFAFFRVGILFCINLTVWYRPMLPDWCAVLLILCGCVFLGDLFKYTKLGVSVGGVAVLVGLVRTWLNRTYLQDEFIPAAAWKSPVAYRRYLPIRILGWWEALLTLVLILLIMKALTDLVKSHTAISYGTDTELSQHATQKLHREMTRKALPVVIGWSMASVFKILELELQPQLGWFWMLQFAVSFVASLLFFSYLNVLADLIEDRFPLQKRA